MFTRILVPLDGSLLAEQALPVAEELACLQHRSIELIQVVDFNQLDHYGLEELVGADQMADQLVVAEREAAAYLETVATPLRHRGLTVTTLVRGGDPSRELVAAANDDDLIVMSTHGRTGFTRVVLGSVTDSVVHRATAPVLVVRAKDTPVSVEVGEVSRLLHRERYRPNELAHLLGMEVAQVRQEALTGKLPAQIVDHHVIWISRADVLDWLHDRGNPT